MCKSAFSEFVPIGVIGVLGVLCSCGCASSGADGGLGSVETEGVGSGESDLEGEGCVRLVWTL